MFFYENSDDGVGQTFPFRRLVFQRTEGLVQYEALLARDGLFDKSVYGTEPKKANSSSKSKRKGALRKNNESTSKMKVYHGFLASSYHTAIIAGFSLISSNLESVASAENRVKAVVIGLGAGLLPMFLHGCMQFIQIEAVELDPTMLNLARDYFSFTEDKRLKLLRSLLLVLEEELSTNEEYLLHPAM